MVYGDWEKSRPSKILNRVFFQLWQFVKTSVTLKVEIQARLNARFNQRTKQSFNSRIYSQGFLYNLKATYGIQHTVKWYNFH
jgi:hypothetical protein